MKISNLKLGVLFISSFVLIGCSNSDSNEEPVVGSTSVTAVDGYIKDANVTDSAGQIGVYTSGGKYTFANSITYPLRSNGGLLEDTNASFDINMTAESGLVLSPITTFLENNSTLLGKLANLDLGSSTLEDFSVDYVDANNTDLAKLAQLLYLVQKDTALLSAFKTSLVGANPTSLSEIFTLAEADVNATMGGYGVTYRAFLSAVLSLTQSPSEYETELESAKAALSEIQHNGTTYGTVTSPYTQRVWLDRNLGASKLCTAYNDSECYGDYYQWGRNFDGHQEINSTVISTLSDTVDNVGSSFIVNSSFPQDWTNTSIDDNGALRNLNWKKADGSSVCPAGFRIPTISELTAETTQRGVTNRSSAFNNFLKFPAAGQRNVSEGGTSGLGNTGGIWSISISNETSSSYFYFTNTNADTSQGGRAYGFNLRCIQDRNNSVPIANAGLDQNVSEGTAVTLDASASSDSDGSIVAYLWEEGGVALSREASFTKSDFSPETHTITLTVTDDYGATSTDTVVVTVSTSISHNGILYGTVTSPFTGRVWLDRNLGASQVCTSYADTACYGDYYQWGRNFDGHEKSDSTTTSTQATDINNTGSDFIYTPGLSLDWTTADDSGSQRIVNWRAIDGSSVCPVGYRVPTIIELTAETTSASPSVEDAYANFLKLPAAGGRYGRNADIYNQGSIGLVSSLSVPTASNYLEIGGTSSYDVQRSSGFSVRCIQNGDNIALNKNVTPLTNTASGAVANVTDGNYATVWYSFEGSLSVSFVVDLGSLYEINRISFLPTQTRTYVIESSNDNQNWTPQHSGSVDFSNAIAQEVTASPTYTARYLRYTGSNSIGDVAFVGIVEFEVYGNIFSND